MPEQTDVVEEQKTDVNKDSSVEEILASQQDEAEQSESSTEEKPTEETEKEPEKAETTEEAEVEDEDLLDGKEDKIPYQRFNKVISQRNDLRQEISSQKAEAEELRESLNNPDVLRAVLKNKGLTEEAIGAQLKEKGFEVAPKTPAEYDWNKTEDWQRFIKDEIGKAVNPVQQTLTQQQKTQQQRELTENLNSQVPEAQKLSKELGLEYGDEQKDLNNIATGVGKMNAYLTKFPEKVGLVAQGHLTKSDILKLAMSDKIIKLGEQKGVKKEQARNEDLKNATMESDETVSKADRPQSDWSVEDIVAWKRKHPETEIGE